MSDQQNTGGKDIRLMLALITAAVVVIVGGGYALWTWLATPPPTPSRVDLNRVTGTALNGAQEQPAYRELLRESNERGAKNAAAANSSFIASIPLQQDVVAPEQPVTPRATPAKPSREVSRAQNNGRTVEQEKAVNEARQKALAGLLAKMQAPPAAESLPDAQLLGGKESGWANWRDTLPGSAVQQAAFRTQQEARNASSPIEIVPPYWRGPGEIYTGINSDNGATPVLGRIKTGPYAGAVLKAPEGAKLSGDGVIIHFTSMALHGQEYKIDAYALQDDTLVANIATDVEHHYVRRIVLPAILKGLGGAGQLYAQANTQVLSNGFNTVTARPSTPDGTAVAGVIVGNAAEQGAQVLTNDAARLPDRTVTVNNGEVVAIQFMRGVYSTDAEASQGATSMNRPAPESGSYRTNPAPTADELRTETQARIRAAENRGNASE
ncbi:MULTISPECIES: conjugal transfer protein TraO [Cronobacter]|uniref:conjugal transfer protein TraO n=1 Tax=Cronobacter TaxID=413496 RepID=UPI000CFF527B|nr:MULTISPECIES: conjugal transfer protein TraO [Cronobacter]EKM0439583.1 conjugal transfer protein TraO [Cronobacter turicensis]WRU16803.1 conjugal transfer protein TraO [Cronobacter malonaticus]